MSSQMSLDGLWKIRPFDGQHGQPEQFVGPDADETLFIDAQVPGEVHLDLMRSGTIGDVNIARNAEEARWVEENIWLYRRTFAAPAEAANARSAWLVFDGIDLVAGVFLNGQQIGSHANAHIPCRINVTGKIKEGTNTLAVRLDSGLFAVADKPWTPYAPGGLDIALHKRMWLRKPQYSFSWDWNPRLINVGIWRPAWLEWCDGVRLDTAVVFPELSDDHRRARLVCRTFVENSTGAEVAAKLRVRCIETGAAVERDVKLPPGTSRQDAEIEVENPKLWWPVGHGEQPMYTVEAAVLVSGRSVGSIARRTGIRSVTINQSPHPEIGKHFIIEVNGRPIFLKGGNYVPIDMIYATANAERYQALVKLALEANFNALRVWGGGLFADHALLDACDEAGIIVWHDFLYACAKYPMDDYDFLQNVRAETTFAVRDLAHHPSLAVWCGNNEIEWGVWGWGYDRVKAFPDYALYHHVIPVIAKAEDPRRPYWPSSPFSPDYEYANTLTSGDQHPWEVSLGRFIDNFWAYRDDVSRFPNEGGVLGASTPATIRQFLPENERRLHSPSWTFHDNAMNFNHQPGVCYRLVENWLGKQPAKMDFDDYLFCSSLMQAEGLKEYIDNFRRRMFSSASAIFWMYNDSWPATHGWTIIDYYLRRKLDYHPVRRAFQPVTVVPAIDGEQVIIFGVNDTPADWRGRVRFGLAGMAGGLPVDEAREAHIPANSSVQLARIPMARWRDAGTKKSIAFALLFDGDRVIAQNRIFTERFKDMEWSRADVSVRRDGGHAVFSSQVFAWCIAIDLDGERPLPDNAFDLLPGIDYRIVWPADAPLPQVIRTGNLA